MDRKKITPVDVQAMKKEGKRISMLTAYDYPMALLEDRAGIEIILVGDSLGMTVLGYENTVPVTMEEMIHHTKAVTRGAKYALIIGDMPFMSYNTSEREAILNAGRFMKEGGADAVKLEGGASVKETLGAIVKAGIPVMGHIGLTPQTISMLGGFKVQGKDAQAAQKIIDDALSLEDAGAFSVLLEAVPAPIAKRVTERLKVPTIGIGAGVHCDGQVLVVHDMLGLFDRFTPKFAKRYVNLSELILKAFDSYRDEVWKGAFPAEQHSFHIDEKELSKLK
ncbi:MAG TPA: 3-methyl-2-oxobutanoate hydroxymethyltransferase [Thermodesulfobacteriota bacterium]|nr:3-methyl-2-oxobutanoate hydroxymethyltransferase [Thermodesulfobacteriota bacterium]